MGINRTGFQLLSLLPHDSGLVASQGRTFADAPCLLPDQLTIYIERYLPLFVFSLVALAVSSFRTVSTHQFHHKDLHLPLSNAPHDHRRESAWGGATTLSPEVLHSQPATPITNTGNSLRLPNNANFRTSAGAPPATPTFHAFSPSANQLDTPVLFNGTGLRISLGSAANGVRLGGRGGQEEEEHEAYEMLMEQPKLLGSTKPGWAQHRERRWMWSRIFVLRNRRRSVSFGVPPSIEAFIRRRFGAQTANRNREPTLLGVFLQDLCSAAWPPLFASILIVYFMFR